MKQAARSGRARDEEFGRVDIMEPAYRERAPREPDRALRLDW
ncbi:MAG: hypothetical protein ACJA2W_000623 [Planctomycetota bacterium]|jgi:hypothetical protein